MNITEKVLNRSVKNIVDLAGKKVLVRIDVNTSLGENGLVDPGEDWRIIKAYQTIEYLVEKDACVILMSHIGRDPKESLRPIYNFMSQHLQLGFIPSYDTELIAHSIENMQHGSVMLLENIRSQEGEKNNDISFLEPVIDLCDLYVNDAFSVSHREHASVHDITSKLPSYFGLQFCDEIQNLSRAITSGKGEHTVLVLGGAKFGTKLDLLEQLLPHVQYALVGGALANVFLRARGLNIGKSFADDVDVTSMIDNQKIVLPVDAIDQNGDVVSVDEISDEDMMLDIGPLTENLFETIIDHATTVLWNGPMGKYEDKYVSGSISVADSVAKSNAFSVTGGGDTATVILEEDLAESFDFISTGGGAMLDFLVEGTLPAIDELLKNNT
jgi:phosphoglycerate kinase